MRKILLTIISVSLISLASFAQNSASIEPIMQKGLKFVQDIEKKYNNKTIITKAEFDFAYDDNYTYVDLSQKFNYVIAGIGDDNIKDLSIIVLKKKDGKWAEVAKDNESSNSTLVTLNSIESGEYALDVKVNKYATDEKIGHVSFFVIAIMK